MEKIAYEIRKGDLYKNLKLQQYILLLIAAAVPIIWKTSQIEHKNIIFLLAAFVLYLLGLIVYVLVTKNQKINVTFDSTKLQLNKKTITLNETRVLGIGRYELYFYLIDNNNNRIKMDNRYQNYPQIIKNLKKIVAEEKIVKNALNKKLAIFCFLAINLIVLQTILVNNRDLFVSIISIFIVNVIFLIVFVIQKIKLV